MKVSSEKERSTGWEPTTSMMEAFMYEITNSTIFRSGNSECNCRKANLPMITLTAMAPTFSPLETDTKANGRMI